MDASAVIDCTRRWIRDVVIGLNLCPFARRVFDAGLIRFVVCEANEEDPLLEQLRDELVRLSHAPRSHVETTILIHPHALTNFRDYNDFLPEADRLVRRLNLAGIIQIASFHPGYQFEGTEAEAIENYTNRSPFPMLHLLREESISEVSSDPAVLLSIPERNIATLQDLGLKKLQSILTCQPPGV